MRIFRCTSSEASIRDKTDAQMLLERTVARRERLVTDAEVLQETVHRYVSLNRREARLSARDAIHLAVMERYGIRSIATFDQGFDAWRGVEWLIIAMSVRAHVHPVCGWENRSGFRAGTRRFSRRLRTCAIPACLGYTSVEQLASVAAWFDEHLPKPTRFTVSAISRFKQTARTHVGRIRELVFRLEHHGVSVRMLKTQRAGYVTYEDEFQVVAEPFSDMSG